MATIIMCCCYCQWHVLMNVAVIWPVHRSSSSYHYQPNNMSQLASYHNASTASSAAVMTAGGTVAPLLAANGALVLFGSQTGNAESIAQVLHASCSATPWGTKSRIFQMNQYITKHTNVPHPRSSIIHIIRHMRTWAGHSHALPSDRKQET